LVTTIESRPYGSTGERVTILGLGCGALAKHSFAQGVATVRRALELGITYFDTSPFYCDGASQAILGETLDGRSEKYLHLQSWKRAWPQHRRAPFRLSYIGRLRNWVYREISPQSSDKRVIQAIELFIFMMVEM
jgi:predicted aldo/keto reductase-like oxidoreductase